jgi:arylsulfatase A-like enzyme
MTGREALCLAFISAFLIGAGGCGASDERRKGDALLLLTIDTLRADRLGVGGDPRARSPFFDRLARGGRQFSVAVTPVPITLPSHATLLSGLVPPEHGARDNGLFRVPDDVPLLPEAFREAGWSTAAFLAALPLAARFGLGRGFDAYHDAPGAEFAQRSAEAVNRDVFGWLDARRDGAPLFLWVHYFDPHAPYTPPRALRRLEGGDAYRGEITYADRHANLLVRDLEDRFGRVRVCATSDHGESLGEHEEETHGVFIYEATTRVPLVFRGEGMPEATIDRRPVSIARVAATLLAWAGVDADEMFGDPLPDPASAAPPDESFYLESMYPRIRHAWAALRGMRAGRWKVIRAPEPEVYDLERDPGETQNLFARVADRPDVARLLAVLESPQWEGRSMTHEPDPEVTAALESLGYVAPPRKLPDGELPDPKDRIRIEHLLGELGSALAAGNLHAARSFLSRALSIDSRNKETQLMRARLEAASGAYDRAFDILGFCLELPPAELDGVVYYETGRVALDSGRLERAEESFARAVGEDPLNVDAFFNWGVVAYREGRFEAAARRWRQALRLDPGHPPSRQWLPEVEARLEGETGS